MRGIMKIKIDLYSSEGIPPGGFVLAVLSNDLRTAIGSASFENRRDIEDIIRYVDNNVPEDRRGDAEKVRSWLYACQDVRDRRKNELIKQGT